MDQGTTQWLTYSKFDQSDKWTLEIGCRYTNSHTAAVHIPFIDHLSSSNITERVSHNREMKTTMATGPTTYDQTILNKFLYGICI